MLACTATDGLKIKRLHSGLTMCNVGCGPVKDPSLHNRLVSWRSFLYKGHLFHDFAPECIDRWDKAGRSSHPNRPMTNRTIVGAADGDSRVYRQP